MAGSCIGWLSSWQKWQQRVEAAGAGAVAAGLAETGASSMLLQPPKICTCTQKSMHRDSLTSGFA